MNVYAYSFTLLTLSCCHILLESLLHYYHYSTTTSITSIYYCQSHWSLVPQFQTEIITETTYEIQIIIIKKSKLPLIGHSCEHIPKEYLLWLNQLHGLLKLIFSHHTAFLNRVRKCNERVCISISSLPSSSSTTLLVPPSSHPPLWPPPPPFDETWRSFPSERFSTCIPRAANASFTSSMGR